MKSSVGDLASPTVATQASPRAAARLGHSVGVNYRKETNYEAWRPALIAFYAADCMPTKAAILKLNAPLDYLDLRTIEALKAALKVAP